jgi:hypothetical protein
MTEETTYQGPLEGFRGEVTREATRVLRQARGICPGCGEPVKRGTEQAHAIDCGELRADVANEL